MREHRSRDGGCPDPARSVPRLHYGFRTLKQKIHKIRFHRTSEFCGFRRDSFAPRHPRVSSSEDAPARCHRCPLEADHRTAAGRRPSLVCRDRPRRRPERSGRAPARAAAHRQRRDAGRRRDRSDAARLPPPGDDRSSGRRRLARTSRRSSRRSPPSTTSCSPRAASTSSAEVVCESDDDLVELLNSRIRSLPGVISSETFVYLGLAEAVVRLGHVAPSALGTR